MVRLEVETPPAGRYVGRSHIGEGHFPGSALALPSLFPLPTGGFVIRLHTLGAVEVRLPDGTVQAEVLAQPKRLAVLLYLAVEPGFHRREKLIRLFWHDSDEERGRNALNKAVHFLRRQLGDDTLLGRGADELSANREAVWCDVAALEEPTLSVDALLATYRGDFADGFPFEGSSDVEHWLDARRAQCRRLAVSAACRGAGSLVSLGDRLRAIELLTAARRWDPFDELLVRALMREQSRAGNRAAAIATYQELARRMQLELDARPSAETRKLVEMIRQTPPDVPSAI
jgi:DNA-binding SARP family transcriptional activator